MGHALTVDEGYYKPTVEYLNEAGLTLNWHPSREVGREVLQRAK